MAILCGPTKDGDPMSVRKTAIGVIPARGGSKGLPGKNIADLGGKPLLAWTIEAALGSKRIDRVVLSTDSEEIADVGRKYGAEVPFLRPAELATDTAPTAPVVEHAISFLEKKDGVTFDYAVKLQPATPFRTSAHIDEAIARFEQGAHESLITIYKHEYPPWWMFLLDGDRIKPVLPWREDPNIFNMSRQRFPKVYRPNGAFYITHRERLRRTGDMINPESCGYLVMGAEESVDIDTIFDLMLARELLAKSRGTNE